MTSASVRTWAVGVVVSPTGSSEAGFEASALRMADEEMCRALEPDDVLRAYALEVVAEMVDLASYSSSLATKAFLFPY